MRPSTNLTYTFVPFQANDKNKRGGSAMRKNSKIVLAIALALVWTFSLFSYAGKPFEGIVEMKSVVHTTMPMMGEQTKQKHDITYYGPGKIKVVELPDSQVTIIRGDKGLVWSIDLKNKTYTEMTFEQIAEMQKQARAQMRQARSQVAQELENLPPEQREMVEQMMQSRMGKAMQDMMEGKFRLTWNKTGDTEKILGYKCVKYVGLLNGQPFMEVWVTDKYDLGETFIAMLRAYGIVGGEGEAEIQPLHGLPLKSITTMDLGMGKVREESVAVKVRKKKIPDSEFELPAGLTKSEANMRMR